MKFHIRTIAKRLIGLAVENKMKLYFRVVFCYSFQQGVGVPARAFKFILNQPTCIYRNPHASKVLKYVALTCVCGLSVLLRPMIDKVHNRLTRLKNDGRLMELLRGSSLVLVFKIIGALAGYVFVILMSEWAGASGYGVFELAYTAIMILTVVGRLGLEGALVKYVSEYFIEGMFGKIRRIYALSSLVVLVMSVILGGVFVLFAEPLSAYFDGKELAESFRWMGYFTPVFALLQLNSEALRGMKRMTDFSLLQNGSIMSIAILGLVLLVNKVEVNGEEVVTATGLMGVQAFCISISILLIVSFFMLFKSHKEDLESSVASRIDFVKVMKTAIPMLISGSLFLVMSWTDTLMVGAFMEDSDVGIYRFAFKMATLITFSQFAINSIAAPMISGFSTTKDVKGLRSIIHQIAWMNLALSLPVFLVFAIFPNWVIDVATSDAEFMGGVTSLRILAIGQLINALCGPVMYTLNMTGHEKDSQRIMLYTAVLNFVLNAILIPRMGILGAAIATTVSMVVWNIAAGLKVYRYFTIISLPIPWRWRPK